MPTYGRGFLRLYRAGRRECSSGRISTARGTNTASQDADSAVNERRGGDEPSTGSGRRRSK